MVMTGARFQLAARQVILRFEDFPGLEVVMRAVSVGQLMSLAGLADEFQAGKATIGQTTQLFQLVASRLVSWNIDGDDGRPVPVTEAGVRSLDTDVFMAIVTVWFEGMTQAPKASPADGMEDLPMEALTN